MLSVAAATVTVLAAVVTQPASACRRFLSHPGGGGQRTWGRVSIPKNRITPVVRVAAGQAPRAR